MRGRFATYGGKEWIAFYRVIYTIYIICVWQCKQTFDL